MFIWLATCQNSNAVSLLLLYCCKFHLSLFPQIQILYVSLNKSFLTSSSVCCGWCQRVQTAQSAYQHQQLEINKLIKVSGTTLSSHTHTQKAWHKTIIIWHLATKTVSTSSVSYVYIITVKDSLLIYLF